MLCHGDMNFKVYVRAMVHAMVINIYVLIYDLYLQNSPVSL